MQQVADMAPAKGLPNLTLTLTPVAAARS